MDEDNILDQLPEQNEEVDANYRWKAFRLFVYGVGIVGIVAYKLPEALMLGESMSLNSPFFQRTFLLALAGLWFFNGLGVYYSIASFRAKEPPNWMWMLALPGNIILFSIACYGLSIYFLGKL